MTSPGVASGCLGSFIGSELVPLDPRRDNPHKTFAMSHLDDLTQRSRISRGYQQGGAMARYKGLLLGASTILALTFPAAAQTHEVLHAFAGANGDGAFPGGAP